MWFHQPCVQTCLPFWILGFILHWSHEAFINSSLIHHTEEEEQRAVDICMEKQYISEYVF